MPRYKLTVEYLGTNFSGWQKQKNSYSVQEAIELASKKLFQEKINLVVAGRTDAGVHAEGQVAHFDLTKDFCSRKILLGINFHLMSLKFGQDISIKKIVKVNSKFSARFSAKKKFYQYLILNSTCRSPILSKNSWWVRNKLDFESMVIASKCLVGSHDFSSFRSKGCQSKSPLRTIESIKVYKEKNIIKFNFIAKSFLYNQVRIIVGTLKDVGAGFYSREDVINILYKKNRKYAGSTAPPQGLTLKRISY